ncbi:MAG: lysylphosphatidylglycerol synthase domain-containing protein [Propionibacteriaceae bacterium]|jgi:uncharacterized membrane protein YbhN (UPF0104 family)|nr:lysylphosphatidylglycerol synthase domain-containing protein [Propionibacteriaceae bacterium]
MSADAPAPPATQPEARVGVHDSPAAMVRNLSDLVGILACALGIALVCLMVVYAHNTTEGMAADVRAFAVLLQRILFVPQTVLEMIVILFPPVAVGLDLLLRRYPVVALRGLMGLIGGIVVAILLVFVLAALNPEALVTGLSIHRGTGSSITIPTYVAAITGLLTAVATPASRPTITWSWNLLWISVVVAVVTTTTSLPGMAIALLVGRMMGYAVRYGLGVASRRAHGTALVEGIQRAGFAPVRIDRVSTVRVSETGATLPGVQTPQFFSDHRLYVMRTLADRIYNVIVLDGDRQVMSVTVRLWRYLRSRAVERRPALSLRQTAERTALLSYTVRSAGVATPAVLAIAEAEDSMIIVREATPPSVSFADLEPEQVTDEILDAMWAQILRAHRCGIAHRTLTPDCFRLSREPDAPTSAIWVLGWEAGDVASPELALRIDLTQMIALIATKVDPARAMASASRALTEEQLAPLGPLLQIPAVPKPTRDRLTAPKEVLAKLRTELAQDIPDAPVSPAQITRVGVRTIIMTVLLMVVIVVVLTTFNLTQVVEAIRGSDWRWAVGAFGFGLVGYAGGAMALMAFSPVKLSFWRVYACQVSAAFVALAAPAGLGPAAINLRMLVKKKVPTPVAAATVALAQVANVVVVVLTLVVLTAVTGSALFSGFEVTPGMLVAVLVVAVAVGVVFVIPRSRAWLLARIGPLLRQTWPRLVELFSSPYRLALGILGNIILVASYITALQWAAFAFKVDLPYVAAAIVYLLGTSAGSVVPTPGGMGAIEVAESASLVSYGVNAGIAASVILLFRLVTYWIRIPLGWFAYRWMSRTGDL